jgi:hypothetical protein
VSGGISIVCQVVLLKCVRRYFHSVSGGPPICVRLYLHGVSGDISIVCPV